MKDKKEPEAVRKGVRGHYHLTYPHLGEPGGLPDSAYEVVVPERVKGGKTQRPEPQSPAMFMRRLKRKARRVARTVLSAPRRAR